MVNLSKCHDLICDNTRTDKEIAEILCVSRRTVLRLRKKLNETKPRGGFRPGAGRPPGAGNKDKYPPAEIPPHPRLFVSNQDFFGKWARSGYDTKLTKRGVCKFIPKEGTPGKGWTFKPRLFGDQVLPARFYQDY